MEPPGIQPEALDRARAAFASDHSLTDDLVPGTFFDDPAYFDSLPREAKAVVCAVQWAGYHPDRPGLCHILSEQCFNKYKLANNENELVAAFACEAMSLRYVLPQHPGRGKSNHHMGLLWQTMWQKSKSPEDLQNALRHYRLAVEHAHETDFVKSCWVNDVAFMLNFRRAPRDLDEVEQLFDRAIELAGANPLKAMYLCNKGYVLVGSSKNESADGRQRLARAVSCFAESVTLAKEYLTMPNKPLLDYPRIFDHASTGFYVSWNVTGDSSHLDQAIECSRLCAEHGSKTRSWDFLRHQSQYLLDRHETSGNEEDLLQATEVADEALEAAGDDPAAVGACRWIIGKVRQRWYHEDSNEHTLQNAIESHQGAADLLPSGSSELPTVLNDLGNALVSMFVRERKPEYLDRGIAAYEQALGTRPEPSQEDILMINSGLGQAMLERFLFWKSEADLNSCIRYYRRSLLETDSKPRRYGLDRGHRRFVIRAGNLAIALQQQFILKKNNKILVESMLLIQDALNGPSPLTGQLRNWLKMHLASCYVYESQMSPSIGKLELALEQFNEALAEENVPAADRTTTSAGRCVALAEKAELTGLTPDYEVALEAYEKLAADLAEGDLSSFSITINLARTHYEMWQHKKGDDPRLHGRQALELYAKVVSNNHAPLGYRINAGSRAAQLVAILEQDYPRAKDLICSSLELLPQAILLHENRLAQLQFVRQFSYVPSTVTALSLAAGDEPSIAINRLESGRATVWDRLIGMRSAVDRLRELDDELAERFASLQKTLLAQAPAVKSNGLTDLATLLPTDETRLQRQRAADDYRAVLEQIRSRPGLEDFLQIPKASTDLQGYAKDAAIVFINASTYRSDAVMVTKDKVTSLRLEQFDMESIRKLATYFNIALRALSNSDPNAVSNACLAYRAIMRWLWQSAAKPILEAIDLTGYSTGPAGKPRLVWVSTGWTSVLPIHAAGDFDMASEAGGPSCVHDVVVSSYTTSLKALTFTRQNALRFSLAGLDSTIATREAVIFTMEKTPGNVDLNVAPEATSFRKEMEPHFTTHVRAQPDSKQVRQELQTATVAHFACHAQADTKDPSKSALLFSDCVYQRGSKEGELKDPQPFTVRTLLNLSLEACQLVYLSGCETGANRDLALRDEGIHLASGFHMAGVPHVVSTLWRVDDAVAARLAGHFYARLKGEDGKIKFETAPEALNLAVREMKDSGVEPILWGSFVYSGT